MTSPNCRSHLRCFRCSKYPASISLSVSTFYKSPSKPWMKFYLSLSAKFYKSSSSNWFWKVVAISMLKWLLVNFDDWSMPTLPLYFRASLSIMFTKCESELVIQSIETWYREIIDRVSTPLRITRSSSLCRISAFDTIEQDRHLY